MHSMSRTGACVQAWMVTRPSRQVAYPASGSMYACSTNPVPNRPSTVALAPASASAASPHCTKPLQRTLPGWLSCRRCAGPDAASETARTGGRSSHETGKSSAANALMHPGVPTTAGNGFSAEPGLGFREDRLIGESGNDAEPVHARNVGGRENRGNAVVRGRVLPQVAEGESGSRIRRPDKLEHERAGRRDIVRECIAALGLRRAVDPPDRGSGPSGSVRPPLRSLPAGEHLPRVDDRFDDHAIAGAPAEDAAERVPDRGLVGRRRSAKQCRRGDDHAGRADPALRGAEVLEGTPRESGPRDPRRRGRRGFRCTRLRVAARASGRRRPVFRRSAPCRRRSRRRRNRPSRRAHRGVRAGSRKAVRRCAAGRRRHARSG